MSRGDELSLPAPLEVDIDEFSLQGDNSFRLWLRFHDGAYLALDFQPGSEGHDVIVDAVAQAFDERLRRLGQHGIVVTGLTTYEENQSEEDVGS